MSTHYGHLQDVQLQAEERAEQQDLEKKLAQIYARIDGGEWASDLTAPRGARWKQWCLFASWPSAPLTPPRPARAVRQLITSGAVKRPQQLTYHQPALLGVGDATAAVDVAALALAAFSSTTQPPSPGAGQLVAAQGGGALALARPPPVYNRALGVDPAARPPKLSAYEQAEAFGLRVTDTAFRNLALPD